MTLREQIEELIAGWRSRADWVTEDVSNGHAPIHEADLARGWRDCANDLEELLASLEQEQREREERIRHGYGCPRDGEPMSADANCPFCCRHGWVASFQGQACSRCYDPC